MGRRPRISVRRAGTPRLMGWLLGVVFASCPPALAEQLPSSDAIAERLAGAIRLESVSFEDRADFEGEPFRALAAYLRDQYPRTHAALELEVIHDYTLLFEWRGSDPDLAPALFMSHLDVVPVEESALEGWDHPPFEGKIVDGYVWGRGALDVKTGVIFWLEAVEALLEEGYVPQRTIYLSFGHDEEIGGREGALAVAERLAAQGTRLAFLFDEGGFIIDGHPLLPDRTVAQIVTAEKSYYTVVLTARGVSGHSSIPPRSTAIGRLARAIQRVEENPMPAHLIQPVREMLETAAPHLGFGERFAFGNLWLTEGMIKRRMLRDDLNATLVRTSFAATLISGGVKDNVIPEKAEATINVRILPGDTPQDVLDHLTRVIDDSEIEIAGTSWGRAALPASANGFAFQMAAEAITEILPEAVVMPGLVPGATDTRHFVDVADEILRFVPMRVTMEQVGGAHGRNERIAVEPLAGSVAIAVGMVRRAGAAVPSGH